MAINKSMFDTAEMLDPNRPSFRESLHKQRQETEYLEKLDKIALAAITGMCANPEYNHITQEELAHWAYLQAKAMIKVRKAHESN